MKYIWVSLVLFLSALPEASTEVVKDVATESSICLVEPTVTVEYYLLDYSGGAETSDDQSFLGTVKCDEKSVSGKFSHGNDSWRLYWFEPTSEKWILVY